MRDATIDLPPAAQRLGGHRRGLYNLDSAEQAGVRLSRTGRTLVQHRGRSRQPGPQGSVLYKSIMSNSTASYRKEADHAKRMADLATDPEIKRQWLELERGYRHLAS